MNRIDEVQDRRAVRRTRQIAEEKIENLLNSCRAIQYERPELALEYSEKARLIAKKAKLTERETFCLRMSAICKFASHDYMPALEMFQTALHRYKSAKDYLGEAKARQNIGATYRAMGLLDDAIAEYRLTEKYARVKVDRKLLMTVLNNLGSLFTSLKRPKEALEAYSECLALAERSDDANIKARLMGNIADLYANLGDDETGIDWSQRSLALHRSNNDAMGIALTLSNLGSIHKRRGNIDLALAMLSEALTVMSTLKDDHSSARIKSVLSQVFLEKGLVVQAEAMAEDAVTVFQNANDVEREIPCLLTLGEIARKRKNHGKANEYLRKANNLSKKLHNPVLRVEIERNLAGTAAAADQKQILKHLTTAVNIARQHQMHEQAAQLYRQLSSICAESGDWKKALQYEKDASEAQVTFDREIRTTHAQAMQLQLDLERAQRESEQVERKNERLAFDLESKERKVNTNLIALAQKNELLAELSEDIKKILSAPLPKQSDMLRNVFNKIELHRRFGEDWKNLSQQLTEVHDDFIKKLTKLEPTMTPTELNIASLLKLNLTSKQIADLLNIALASVEVYRYRLRKKLGIQSHLSIPTFLQNL